jgi:transposase
VPRSFTRPWPPEFRAEAVRLVREGGRAVTEVASSLGVSHESLRAWVKQSDLDSGRRRDGLASDEREELRRPRCVATSSQVVYELTTTSSTNIS